MQPRLEGKVIIVAGAGGIGNELARRYCAEGASVLLGDIDEAKATAAVEEIVADGGKAIAMAVDGSAEASVKAAVERAVSEFGALHGFHANFASFADGALDADILGLPLETYDGVMRVNTRGFVICTQAAIPAMLESGGGGSMVYTSSGAAYMGEPVRVAYAMSKAALHALMRHVARKFGPDGIRANVIAPGVIAHQGLIDAMPEEVRRGFMEANLFKNRLGAPGDIAAMGALLMSDEGAYVTGQVINVDGGDVMRP